MTLDLTSFASAIRQLENALEYCNSHLAQSDPALAVHLRAAAIQAFEFTYELEQFLKSVKRFSDKNCGKNKELEHSVEPSETKNALSIKMLKRQLRQIESSDAVVRDMSFDTLIRRGWAIGLLNEEITRWREFRKQRGTTSHTYDAKKAELIYQEIPRFLKEAQYLYAAIEKRQST